MFLNKSSEHARPPAKVDIYVGNVTRQWLPMLVTVLTLVSGWIFFSGYVQAASFDCEKTSSTTEKIICGNDDLSKLDDELDIVYQQRLERSEDKQKTIKEQRQWLKEVRNTCHEMICLKKKYLHRIGELKLFTYPEDATQSGIATKEITGPWLRLYSEMPGGISVDATQYQAAKPIPIEALFVTFKVKNVSYYVSYLTGERSPNGCFYYPVNQGLKPSMTVKNGGFCSTLQKKVALKFKNEIEYCSKLTESEFFAAADLSSGRCLVVGGEHISITDGFMNDITVRRINENMVHSYLHFDENKALGCYNCVFHGHSATDSTHILPPIP